MIAPSPSAPTESDGNLREIARHRHRRTASCTCLVMTAGGSARRSSCKPRSVIHVVASTMVHPSLVADKYVAAAGPYATFQGCTALSQALIASFIVELSEGMGNHSFHTAIADCPMGPTCATKAGSALPVADPSARISARSRSCPHIPLPSEPAAATARLCCCNVDGGTPKPFWPHTKAAVPPVRFNLLASPPACRSI